VTDPYTASWAPPSHRDRCPSHPLPIAHHSVLVPPVATPMLIHGAGPRCHRDDGGTAEITDHLAGGASARPVEAFPICGLPPTFTSACTLRQPEVRCVRPVQMPVHRCFGGAVASRLPRFHPRRSRITSTPGPIGASCGGPRRRAGCRLASPASWLAPSASRLVCFQHCWLPHRDAGPAIRATIPSYPMVQLRPRGPKARSGAGGESAPSSAGSQGRGCIDAVCSDSVYCLPNTGSLAGMSRINASLTHASASLPNTQGHRCIPPNS